MACAAIGARESHLILHRHLLAGKAVVKFEHFVNFGKLLLHLLCIFCSACSVSLRRGLSMSSSPFDQLGKCSTGVFLQMINP